VVGELPLEACDTINGAWGFNLGDHRWKSAKELLAIAVRAAGLNANTLLNVGPMPNGKIQPEAVERLRALGAWLKTYGDSIYGTRAGPVPPRPWGATTRKGQTVYLHILDWTDPVLAVPALGGKVRAARSLKDGRPVKVEDAPGGGLLVPIPSSARDPMDTVIAVDLSPP
jgi:alpha-L-fucosidase